MSGKATARFRALHERDGILVMPNPWDAGTAKMLRYLGFEALATGSAPFAATLGRRDGQVERAEAIGHAGLIAAVTGLPVNGDLEKGYGDTPDAVAETIRQAIAGGLAGCSIEDASGDPAAPLFDRELAVERIGAARATIDEIGSDFVLTARCEAYLTGHEEPLTESVERLGAMAEAGADVVYACGIAEADDIETLVKAVPRPVNVLGGTGPEPLSVQALQDLGVKRVSLGPRLYQAAMGAYLAAIGELKDEGTFGFMENAANLSGITAMFGTQR